MLVFFLNAFSNTTHAAALTITLASATPAAPAAGVNTAINNNKFLIYQFSLARSNNSTAVTVTSFTFTTNSGYTSSDIGQFQLYVNAVNDFSTSVQVPSSNNITTSLGAGTHVFSGFNYTIPQSTTVYFYITADIPSTATVGDIISVPAITFSNMTLTGSPGTAGSASAGGNQTISKPYRTWTGAVNSNFNTHGNWNPDPGADISTSSGGDSLVISPSGTQLYAITMIADATIGAFTYNSSSSKDSWFDAAQYNLIINGTTTATNTGDGNFAITAGSSSAAGGSITYVGDAAFNGQSNSKGLMNAIYSKGDDKGTLYIKGNFTLGLGAGSDININMINKVVFDGPTGSTQTISVNGNFYSSFGKASTEIGGTVSGNSPTVVITSTGAGKIDTGIQISGDLNINNNSTLVLTTDGTTDSTHCTANRLSNGGTIRMAAGSTMVCQGSKNNTSSGATIYVSNFPQKFGAYIFDPTSTVEFSYGGTPGTKYTIPSAPVYGNLILSSVNNGAGATSKTPTGNLTIAGSLTIKDANTTFHDSSAFSHTVAGNWTNNGTYTANTNTITFNGTGTKNINGSSSTTFYNLTINTALSADLVALSNTHASKTTSVTNTLTLTRGGLSLNSQYLWVTRANTGAISRASPGYIKSECLPSAGYGYLRWSVNTTTGSYVYPFGKTDAAGDYIPFTFNITSAGVIGAGTGNVDVATYPTAANNTPYPTTVNNVNRAGVDNSTNVVDRFWQIDVGHITTKPTATMIFSCTSSEASGVSTLKAQRWNSTIWDAPLGSQSYTATTATVPGVNSFSPWTLSGNILPLPIELIGFTSKCDQSKTKLIWSTASETNNDHFDVEKSFDGINFNFVAKIIGAGNSSSLKKYSFIDESASSTDYYRLKQIDTDGKFTYSSVINSDCRNNEAGFSVFPNPSDGRSIFVNVSGINENKQILVVLYDIEGRELYSKIIVTEKSSDNIFAIDQSEKLPAGIYFVTATSDRSVYNQKLVIY